MLFDVKNNVSEEEAIATNIKTREFNLIVEQQLEKLKEI